MSEQRIYMIIHPFTVTSSMGDTVRFTEGETGPIEVDGTAGRISYGKDEFEFVDIQLDDKAAYIKLIK